MASPWPVKLHKASPRARFRRPGAGVGGKNGERGSGLGRENWRAGAGLGKKEIACGRRGEHAGKRRAHAWPKLLTNCPALTPTLPLLSCLPSALCSHAAATLARRPGRTPPAPACSVRKPPAPVCSFSSPVIFAN
jgi:hypothetical protein